MFCNQCEQTQGGRGCTDVGVCGKDEDVQSLQEILLYGLKGMAAYANHARRLGKVDDNVSAFIEEALFSTMTNVNFDIPTLIELVLECGRQNVRVMQMLDEGHAVPVERVWRWRMALRMVVYLDAEKAAVVVDVLLDQAIWRRVRRALR